MDRGSRIPFDEISRPKKSFQSHYRSLAPIRKVEASRARAEAGLKLSRGKSAMEAERYGKVRVGIDVSPKVG